MTSTALPYPAQISNGTTHSFLVGLKTGQLTDGQVMAINDELERLRPRWFCL
jgi:hypothetical protein